MSTPLNITRELEAEIMADPARATDEMMALFEARTADAAAKAPLYWRKLLPEEKLADETPEKLREIVQLLARNNDIQRAYVAFLTKMVRDAIAAGKNVDRGRHEYFNFIRTMAKGHALLAGLIGVSAFETEAPTSSSRLQRDVAARKARKALAPDAIAHLKEGINTAAVHSTGIVKDGCPEVEWPDPSLLQMPHGYSDEGEPVDG